MAIYANLVIDQGSTFNSTITVEEATGAEISLEGYSVRAQIRKTYTSSTAVDFIAEIVDPDNGIITLKLAPAASGSLKPGRYVYDVEIITPNEDVTRVVEGQIEITPRVTRPAI